MQKVIYTGPYLMAAQNMITQAEDKSFTKSARLRYLKDAKENLEKALRRVREKESPEIIQIAVKDIEKEQKRIKELRQELAQISKDE